MPKTASTINNRGIYYGYRIVAACCIIQAVNLGGVFTFGLLFPELEREFGWSRTTISGASSFAFFIMGVCSILMGQAGDRFGPRALLTAAGILFGLGYALLFQMEAAWELYLYYGLMVGVALAAHDVITLSTVTRWFLSRRGLMTGIVKAGAGCGQVIMPLIAAALIAGLGWRSTCFIFGIAAAIALVAAAQVQRRNPASLGLKALGETLDTRSNLVPQEKGTSLKEAVSSRTLWALCIAKFCDLFCLFTIVVHIVPFSADHGMGPSAAAGILSTIGAMSIAGRIALGSAYDRFGARQSLIVCFIILAISLALLQVSESIWSLFLFAAIYGPAHGGFFTITSPSVAEYYGTRAHGTLFGLVISFGTFGATLGPIVAGSLFDSAGNYNAAFALLLGISLLGLCVASTLPR